MALFMADALVSCVEIQSDISFNVSKSSGASATTFAIPSETAFFTEPFPVPLSVEIAVSLASILFVLLVIFDVFCFIADSSVPILDLMLFNSPAITLFCKGFVDSSDKASSTGIPFTTPLSSIVMVVPSTFDAT